MYNKSAKENDKKCITCIVNELQDACKLVKNYDFDTFFNNPKIQKSVRLGMMNVEEFSKSISPYIKEKYTNTDWEELSNIRSAFTENNEGMNVSTLWDITTAKYPSFLKKLRSLAKKEEFLAK